MGLAYKSVYTIPDPNFSEFMVLWKIVEIDKTVDIDMRLGLTRNRKVRSKVALQGKPKLSCQYGYPSYDQFI
jgi:hypothetical protein